MKGKVECEAVQQAIRVINNMKDLKILPLLPQLASLTLWTSLGFNDYELLQWERTELLREVILHLGLEEVECGGLGKGFH